MTRLRFRFESGSYTVMDGERFIGRVSRSRGSYEHSNGRTYRFWSWASHPPLGESLYHHKTRSAAAKYLITRHLTRGEQR